MKRYPKYKDSGVSWLGSVPEHWDILRSRFVCSIGTGSADTEDKDESGDVPFYVRSQTIERLPVHTHEGEAVLTAGDGAGVGKVYHYHPHGLFAAHQRVYVMQNFKRVTGRYFYYAFSGLFAKVALGGGAKSTVDSLRRPMLTNYYVTVPPKDEQHAIVEHLAASLAKIDASIASQVRMIELLKERRSAIITQAVTKGIDPKAKTKDSGVPWLGRVPVDWIVLKLSRLIDSRRRITYGIVQAGEDVVGGVKYIRPVDMTNFHGVKDESSLRTTSVEIAEQYRRSAVKAGDVVFSIGPSYGKVMIVPSTLEGANLTQGTARLAPDEKISPLFLFYALQSSLCKSQWDVSIGGATFGGLNLQPLARTFIPLPPRTEQDIISNYLVRACGDLDKATSSQERMIELLKERRSAIITQAVTGQIDLR